MLTDALAIGADNTGHELGKGAPRLLIRPLTCPAGEVRMHVDVRAAPRVRAHIPCSRTWPAG